MEEKNEIQRLQDVLPLIRRTVGWSAEEFGEKLGLTRQTINNLEIKKTDMSKVQYIAIRSILDDEMKKWKETSKDTNLLELILDMFVDQPEKYKDEDREAVLYQANMMTPSILAKTATREEVSKAITGMPALIGAVTTFSGLTGLWLSTILLIGKKASKGDLHSGGNN